METGLIFVLLFLTPLLYSINIESPDPESCIDTKFCKYLEERESPLVFRIVCGIAEYNDTKRMLTCLSSAKEHTVSQISLMFSTPTVVENALFEGVDTKELALGNVLKIHDAGFDKIQSLKSLLLGYGQLSEIPASVRSLGNLSELVIFNQKFARMSASSFQEMASLESLRLSNMPILEIDSNAFKGLKSLHTLELESCHLTFVPTDAIKILPALKSLSLKYNEITELKSNAFPKSLTNLNISDNPVFYVEDDAFAGLTGLAVLDLSNGNLTSVPNMVNLSKLERLVLDFNRISSIRQDAFAGLENVTFISLDGNKFLSEISQHAFRNLNNLHALWMQNCNLTYVPTDALKDLSVLKSLSLKNNEITKLNSHAFPKSVADLNLRGNSISSIEKHAFAGLTELTDLDMSFNDLTSVGSIGNLSKLQRLLLHNNRISSISNDAFAGLEKISLISLYSNQLTSVPSDAIQNLSSLESLNLNYNQIKELKQNDFLGLHSLSVLTFRDNKISKVAVDAFAGLESSLKDLDLGLNNLTKIPVKALQSTKNLHHVVFGSCIEYVEADTFKHFGHKLERIDLAVNRIKSFAKTAFHHLPNLKELYLNDNQIHHGDFAVFQPIINGLEKLYLQENMFPCNCELYWYYVLSTKVGPSLYRNEPYWVEEFSFGEGFCKYENETILHFEQECDKQEWKSNLCNETSLYGCLSVNFCKDETGY